MNAVQLCFYIKQVYYFIKWNRQPIKTSRETSWSFLRQGKNYKGKKNIKSRASGCLSRLATRSLDSKGTWSDHRAFLQLKYSGQRSRSWHPCLPVGLTKKTNVTPAKSCLDQNIPPLSSTGRDLSMLTSSLTWGNAHFLLLLLQFLQFFTAGTKVNVIQKLNKVTCKGLFSCPRGFMKNFPPPPKLF